ncbi:MAG: hypothetical protein NVSMB47_19840 [Polyangiales bacterium]
MAFWQYSWTATVPGIGGGVDADRFNGTLDDLKAFVASDKPPTGKLETASCTSLAGWAEDPDTVALPVRVELYLDVAAGAGVSPWQTVSASMTHGALGDHGFDIPPPMRSMDGKPHAVHAYAVDTSGKGPSPELTSSPQTITCPPPPLPTGVRRSVPTPAVLTAWKWSVGDVLRADPSKVAALPRGPEFPLAPVFVRSDPGAGGDGALWAIDGTHRRKVAGEAVLASWRIDRSVVEAWTPAKINSYLPTVDWRAAPFLVEAIGAPEVWVIDADPTASGDAGPTVVPAPPKGGVGGNEATATDASASSGCGCTVVGAATSPSWAWSLASAAALVLRRRSRRWPAISRAA